MSGLEGLMDNSKNCLKVLKELDIPMIVTEQYSKGLGLLKKLQSALEIVISHTKMTFSGLCTEEIKAAVKIYFGKKNILVCGVRSACMRSPRALS